jgi:hypothetical protein
MIPQAFPLTIWLVPDGDPISDCIEAVVIGWVPVSDPEFTKSEIGSRYAPVCIMPGGNSGAWPVDIGGWTTYPHDPRGE